MANIRIDGSWYTYTRPTISNQELRDFMRAQGMGDLYGNDRVFTYTSTKSISPNHVPDSPTPVDPQAVLQVSSMASGVVYGADLAALSDEQSFLNLRRREKFILAQVFQISERYYAKNNNAISLHRNGDFVVIRDFPLPFKGDWVGRSATICFHFPKDYPHQAPVGYFIDANLKHRGRGENHHFQNAVYSEPIKFFNNHELSRKGYGFFCLHVEKNWRPDLSNPLMPDNLNSFLRIATLSLDSRAFNAQNTIQVIR